MCRISSLRNPSIRTHSAICPSKAIKTKLFFVMMTTGAIPTWINHTTNADPVSNGIFHNFWTNLCYNSSDFMTWDNRIFSAPPFIPSIMNIRMTNTCIVDFDKNILWAEISTLNGYWLKWFTLTKNSSCICGNHSIDKLRTQILSSCDWKSILFEEFYQVVMLNNLLNFYDFRNNYYAEKYNESWKEKYGDILL